MKIRNLLSKPIILSLLFLFILFCISFCVSKLLYPLYKGYSITLYPLFWAVSAIIISIKYAKFNNALLLKGQMVKISIYSFIIVFLFHIFIMSQVISSYFNEPLHFVNTALVLLIPTVLILLSSLCTYPALNLGCNLLNHDLSPKVESEKFKNFLLIIFITVIGIFFYRYNSEVLKSIKPHILNYMVGKGYIHKTNFKNLKIKSSKNEINIVINEPIELDFKSKQQVLNLRKKYAAMSPAFIPANYTPSDTVFGQIQDTKPWWGLNGMMFKGAGKHSIDGLSEESRAINNPLLLFIVDPNFWFVNMHLNGAEIYPKPVSIEFQPSKKTIYVVYNVTAFDEAMNDYLVKNVHETFGDSNEYTLAGLNARDFGYNYAYAYSSQNISYENPSNNLSTNVQQLHNFLHTGGSCGYLGGCNNISPAQPFLNFKNLALPAQIGIKLWKKMPADKNSPADIYFIITLK